MSVPLDELTRPERWPSTLIMALKLASPVTTVPPPTKPLSVPSLMSRAKVSLSVMAREEPAVTSATGFASVVPWYDEEEYDGLVGAYSGTSGLWLELSFSSCSLGFFP